MKSSRLVELLREVPPKRLLIIDLVRELTDAEGRYDVVRAAARQPELNLAKLEAKNHIAATEHLRTNLGRLHDQLE